MTGSYLEGVEIHTTIDLPSNDLGALDIININNTQFISIARSEDATSSCGNAFILECRNMTQCHVLQTFTTNAVVMEFFGYNNKSALLIDHRNQGIVTES